MTDASRTLCKTCQNPIPDGGDDEFPICPTCIVNSVFMDEEDDSVADDENRYDIKREVGRGGDGTVYLGYDKSMGREIALKLMKSWRDDSEQDALRFQTEIEAVTSLDHPNIIPIYSTGEFDGRPFYTMKYVPGGSLAQNLDKYQDARKAVSLMITLAQAVQHAHERGILHRDLKPSNVLISDEGVVYLTDFGLARSTKSESRLTLTGAVMGTPHYMSPEQARGDTKAITLSSDLFSLGSMFYECLTGMHPFNGDSPHVVLKQVIEKEIYFTRSQNKGVDQDLKTVLLKCLEKEPSRRYVSAQALADDLTLWKEGFPVKARKVSTFEKFRRWIYRHPLPSAAITLAVFSLIVGTIVSYKQWQRAEDERETAEELAYFSNVANAFSARENYDFREARDLLSSSPESRRKMEWNLVNNLCRGDQEWLCELPNSSPVNFARLQSDAVLLLHDGSMHRVDLAGKKLKEFGKLPQLTILSPDPVRLPGLRELSFSPDGRHYTWIDNRRIAIAKTEAHSLMYQTGAPQDASVAWLDDERIIYAIGSKYNAGGDGREAYIYNLETKTTEKIQIKDLGGPIVLSPDGSMIAMVYDSGDVVVFRVNANFPNDLIFRRKRDGIVHKLAFSPDGRYLSASWRGNKNRVEVLDILEEKRLLKLNWPTSSDLNFVGNEHLILTGREAWFTSWNFMISSEPPYFYENSLPHAPPYRADGPFRPPPQLLSRATRDRRTRFHLGHSAPISTSIVVADSLLTASHDGTLRCWSLKGHSSDFKSGVHSTHTFYHPHASHNGDYVIYLNEDDFTEVWHRPSGECFQFAEDHYHLAVLNDGRALTRLLTTAETFCWQLEAGKSPRLLWKKILSSDMTGGKRVNHCSLSPDERFLGVQRGGRLIVLDLQTGEGSVALEQNNTVGTTPGQTAAISPDGKLVATTGFRGHSTRIYQAHDLSLGHRFVIPEQKNTSRDSACVFSPDGTRLYAGNNDGSLKVYAMPEGKEIPQEGWQIHSTEVTALAISQDGQYLASSGDDGMIIWSTKSKKKRLRLPTGNRNWIQFTKEDSLLYHCGPLGSIEVFQLQKSEAHK